MFGKGSQLPTTMFWVTQKIPSGVGFHSSFIYLFILNRKECSFRFFPDGFEAKSARDGAWYDVAAFLSHRYLDTGDPDVLVRFAGFGPEEDEWVNVKRNVRQRSLPCESSECVVVIPGISYSFSGNCATEESLSPPETDYRLQQLHASNESGSVDQQKPEPSYGGSISRIFPTPPEIMQKLHVAVDIAGAGSVVKPPSADTPMPAGTTAPEPKPLEISSTDSKSSLPFSNFLGNQTEHHAPPDGSSEETAVAKLH
ncbi:Protein SAWADEE homeodomain-like 2 [Vitis vinifera]|uniref:Protein SAWADEE homeodomain-like 2 n=1 Tax=Vitis vinifera TaxID=29760 RepID=A0A438E5M0_VITVI|nr:Protein SAWADEE homeodomain-like 2 [Vitis vinifera]